MNNAMGKISFLQLAMIVLLMNGLMTHVTINDGTRSLRPGRLDIRSCYRGIIFAMVCAACSIHAQLRPAEASTLAGGKDRHAIVLDHHSASNCPALHDRRNNGIAYCGMDVN